MLCALCSLPNIQCAQKNCDFDFIFVSPNIVQIFSGVSLSASVCVRVSFVLGFYQKHTRQINQMSQWFTGLWGVVERGKGSGNGTGRTETDDWWRTRINFVRECVCCKSCFCCRYCCCFCGQTAANFTSFSVFFFRTRTHTTQQMYECGCVGGATNLMIYWRTACHKIYAHLLCVVCGTCDFLYICLYLYLLETIFDFFLFALYNSRCCAQSYHR